MQKLEHISILQFADILSISHMGVRSLIKSGEIPAHRIGKKFIILKKDAQHYVDNLPVVKGGA